MNKLSEYYNKLSIYIDWRIVLLVSFFVIIVLAYLKPLPDEGKVIAETIDKNISILPTTISKAAPTPVPSVTTKNDKVDLDQFKSITEDLYSRIDNKLSVLATTGAPSSEEKSSSEEANTTQYFVTLANQQNLLVTMRVYNNLLKMVTTKEGRAYLNNELINLKQVNNRLVKLRKNIYAESSEADKQKILIIYNKLTELYDPAVPLTESEYQKRNKS